ncbi:PREDICTED: BTB/POZ domain-containing protein At1g63850-like isoform X2 [Tarenaya hassleriana]|uniref:BTB/POZ domain-containing protein At1g63850-like isoform X2 n=1 Tax=Tarenaya hassleriana TaxID=28532 RepID=UPI00053C2C6A|nr:PREDICTED: BTB/POZ domain-containing protein At1g63850-like isoform X2 [Tarenaya hassleriana]
MVPGNAKKRPRVSHTRLSSAFTRFSSSSSYSAALVDSIDTPRSPENLLNLRRTSSSTFISAAAASSPSMKSPNFFNDSATADVILRLYHDSSPFERGGDDDDGSGSSPSPIDSGDGQDLGDDVRIYLHSDVLRRAKYFAALLSDRWRTPATDGYIHLNLAVTAGSIATHLAVLELLYTDGFSDVIDSASTALDILPVALELLFDDCVRSSIRFLEAVPWTDEEERRVLSLVPFLREEESTDLLARVSPSRDNSCEEMLHGLILAAIHSHPNMAFVKAFVAKLLRDFSSKETARKVLERAFVTSLKVVKESLEEYSSPDFRGDHNETEAMQRLSLHTAMVNGKHLIWVVERMIELRVADTAVKEWSEQAAFTADLQRAFRDDAWRNMAPGLPAVVLRCTCKLADAVASGSILAARQN